jgi:putative PIN family toxin of toxin-antitoxin system
MIPVVMDTGAFVAGVFWRSEPHKCVKVWLTGVVSLVVTDAIYEEYERTLRRVKLQQGFDTDLSPWLTLVRDFGVWNSPDALPSPVRRDPKDDIMIEAALAGQAHTIIARDKDLTTLEKPFGIHVVTPRQWLGTLPREIRRTLD